MGIFAPTDPRVGNQRRNQLVQRLMQQYQNSSQGRGSIPGVRSAASFGSGGVGNFFKSGGDFMGGPKTNMTRTDTTPANIMSLYAGHGFRTPDDMGNSGAPTPPHPTPGVMGTGPMLAPDMVAPPPSSPGAPPPSSPGAPSGPPVTPHAMAAPSPVAAAQPSLSSSPQAAAVAPAQAAGFVGTPAGNPNPNSGFQISVDGSPTNPNGDTSSFVSTAAGAGGNSPTASPGSVLANGWVHLGNGMFYDPVTDALHGTPAAGLGTAAGLTGTDRKF